MDIVFMGTPDFAVFSLEKLVQSEEIHVRGVVTQPDRKRGRGQKLQSSPVKKKALEYNLDIFQEENINTDSFIKKLRLIDPEVIVVVAFGQKIGNEILNLPQYGCINLHASLLPKYRGASPIHQAIINGDKITGVTTMYMDEDWDTGDIIYKEEVEIQKKDTVGDLHDKLAEIGSDLLVKTVIDVGKGTAPSIEQDDSKATYAYKIEKDLGEIDWTLPANKIYDLVRGVNPWPGAYTFLDGKLLKIWQISISGNSEELSNEKDNKSVLNSAGQIIAASEEKGIIVQTGKGKIKIEKLQLAGRKRMSAVDFLHGYELEKGEILG